MTSTPVEQTGPMAVDTQDLAPGCVLLLGGRSQIGLEVARQIGAGRVVILAARRSGQLDAERQVMLDSGASDVDCVDFEADETDKHAGLLTGIADMHGPIGVAVLAFGILGDQSRAEQDPGHAVEIVHTDYVAQVGVLTTLANLLALRETGTSSSSVPWPALVSGGRTTSTAPPRPASTASPVGSRMRSTAPVYICCWRGRGS